jgi:hypothetical protein
MECDVRSDVSCTESTAVARWKMGEGSVQEMKGAAFRKMLSAILNSIKVDFLLIRDFTSKVFKPSVMLCHTHTHTHEDRLKSSSTAAVGGAL